LPGVPDRELSSQLYKEYVKLIDNSPLISKYFKALRSEIRCTINNSVYRPLAYSVNRLDGRLAVGWLSDESGALPSSYPILSMKSSQVTLDERMGIIISTAYESIDNPMTEQVDYAKKVLDGLVENDNIFALLYEPDDPKQWFTDQSLYQANPLALEVEVIKNSIMEKRQEAIDMPSAMTNFKTKHLNIFVDGNELEQYISLEDLREGKIEVNSYDWKGKEVWLGIDLSKLLDTISVMV
jgi:phage terminase large subunit-like protein